MPLGQTKRRKAQGMVQRLVSTFQEEPGLLGGSEKERTGLQK
jgi:hypothetical protein